MADEIISLSNGFSEPDEAQWLALVDKALKGAPAEKLNSRTSDGLEVKALYRSPDAPTSDDPAGYPGLEPFIRGAQPLPDAYLPWDIRQIVSHADIATANSDILKDLTNGVTSIELRIDESGGRGVCIRNADDIVKVLDGVMLDLAPVGLDVTGESSGGDIAAAAMLMAAIDKRGDDPAKLKIAFNIDPIGSLVRKGYLAESFSDSLNAALLVVEEATSKMPDSTVIRIDSRPVHEAGGSEAQELGLMSASVVAYLKAGLALGIDGGALARSFLFTFSVGANAFQEVAKLKAARRIWARILDAFDIDSTPMKMQAVSARRMLTARDPWTNMLRNASACFAAGVGGADIVTIRPFTDALGLPSSLGRRVARNTQIIAQEESFLGKVMDPTGGAWSVADLSDKMAQAGWKSFQTIETEGGIENALSSGSFQWSVGEVRVERTKAIARRKVMITGVSDFPNLDETPAPVVKVDLKTILASAATPIGLAPESHNWSDLLKAASKGATLEELRMDGDAIEVNPLWPMRLSKPFDRLRQHANKQEAKTGIKPTIFLAALGDQASHTPRLTFARNFFAAGGIESVVATGSPQELEKAMEDSGCILACICGSDANYESEATDTARALGAAGVARLYLAGKPGDHETLWREAGVDEFIHIGVNAINSLEIALSEIGLAI